MAITQVLTPPVTAPSRQRPTEFATEGDAFLFWMEKHGDELIAWTSQANALEESVNTSETTVLAISDNASALSGAVPYNPVTVYNYPDAAIGSDGVVYRMLNTGISGDNPVGSITGNWHNTEYKALFENEENIEVAHAIALSF